jgi:hypothetical protein
VPRASPHENDFTLPWAIAMSICLFRFLRGDLFGILFGILQFGDFSAAG